MATGSKGTRRRMPPAAVAPQPASTPAPRAAMTAGEAAPAIEAAHAAADVALPVEIVPEALTVEIPAAVPATDAPSIEDEATTPEATTAEDSIMDTQTTTNDVADKGQEMFAEANDRAKGAMEKGAHFLAELAEFNKGTIEALVESSKIAARGFETMGQDAAAFARSSWEQGSAAMRTLATVKSPTEFMKLQADYAREAFDTVVAQGSRSTEASLKLAGEVAQPISNRVAIAADKLKIAA